MTREHHTINLLLFSSVLLVDHSETTTKKPNNGFSLKENHYVIIAIMIFISTDAHEVRKKAFGICHHNQSHKNVKKINKFIALVL
jgi:hypothetical protein